MNPKHTNPEHPDHVARAPYNFVPLPEKVVPAESTPPQDHYYSDRHTGYIECALTTESPIYTRAALNPEFFQEWNENLCKMMKDGQARAEYARFFHLGDMERPVIPGSSLRGMVRALIEIAGYGKMKWVGDELKVTFRAVAAPGDDPLREPYEQALGRYGRNVQAGYLVRRGDEWYVRPALRPVDIGLPGREHYLKVKGRQIQSGAIPGFKPFSAANYRPQYHEVSFEAEARRGKRGKYAAITKIVGKDANYAGKGVLVCTGNMRETGDPSQPSPRRNYALVLQRNDKAGLLKIPEQVVKDYLAGLTPFQKEPPFDERYGCLQDDYPVFYIERGGEILAFGHAPNFRIPAWLAGTNRTATPLDFVPDGLRQENDIDLAEAIFGYVPEGERKEALAGRVFVTDAHYESERDGLWLSPEPITPQILGGPKPTTFQHYLVQDRDEEHDPDSKRQLAHYATPTDETVIRGHKLYWHKGQVGLEDIRESNEVDWSSDTQHTQIKLVKPGVTFRFHIYFENLSKVELGALLWALTLPGEAGREYRHKIGMGKPLGMGAVKLNPTLYLSDRQSRYRGLLDTTGKAWLQAKLLHSDLSTFISQFEQYVLENMGSTERGKATSFHQVERIKMLLKMLEWPGPERQLTRYMQIEGPNGNEYKDRPVLPDPLSVERLNPEKMAPRTRTASSKPVSRRKSKGRKRRRRRL